GSWVTGTRNCRFRLSDSTLGGVEMKSFIFGAMIGAGVALLYAPATGQRTRSMIKDKATSLKNDIEDFAESKGRHLSNKMQGYRARARRAAEMINEKISTAKQPDMSIIGESAF